MAKVSPFCAFHYDSTKIAKISDVIIPPYDNIPAGDEKKYLGRNPYNFAHVLLPQDKQDDYSRASALLKKWREVGVIKDDPTPSYYIYRQYFTANGKRHMRTTLMCTVDLCPFSDGVVRPHENTHGEYRKDRLQILKKTKSNLSHVFGMVRDIEGFLESLWEKFEFEKPLLEGQFDDGTDHIVWRLDSKRAPEVEKFFKDKPIYIVDGHHRYSSALAYAEEVGAIGKPDHPASKMLFAIANAYDPGLVVFPTHRALNVKTTATMADFEKEFQLSEISSDDLPGFVAKPTQSPEFALWFQGKLFHVQPKDTEGTEEVYGKSVASLGVHWSDEVLLKKYCGIEEVNRASKISYEKDTEALWKNRDKYQLIVFHATPAVESVLNIADDKQFMPQKSTFFYPKLAAGLIMRKLS